MQAMTTVSRRLCTSTPKTSSNLRCTKCAPSTPERLTTPTVHTQTVKKVVSVSGLTQMQSFVLSSTATHLWGKAQEVAEIGSTLSW